MGELVHPSRPVRPSITSSHRVTAPGRQIGSVLPVGCGNGRYRDLRWAGRWAATVERNGGAPWPGRTLPMHGDTTGSTPTGRPPLPGRPGPTGASLLSGPPDPSAPDRPAPRGRPTVCVPPRSATATPLTTRARRDLVVHPRRAALPAGPSAAGSKAVVPKPVVPTSGVRRHGAPTSDRSHGVPAPTSLDPPGDRPTRGPRRSPRAPGPPCPPPKVAASEGSSPSSGCS